VAKIIDLPKLSPTMEEGTLVRWAKNEGDKIEVDDLLAEVETDKATMEFRSFDKGTLLKRLVGEGQTAKLGQPVAIFGLPGEDVSELLARVAESGGAAAPVAAAPPTVAPVAPAGPPPTSSAVLPAALATAAASSPGGPGYLFESATSGVAGLVLRPVAEAKVSAGEPGGPSSPRVRKLARELGIEIDAVVGSGENGRVLAGDVERAAAGRPAPSHGAGVAAVVAGAVGAMRAADEVKPASQMRKAIARRLVESKQTVPHFYLEVDLDVEALLSLREQINDGVDKTARISVNDMLIRACALALREVPASNASWVDGSIVLHHRSDISVAVAVEDGLVTPVVRDADRKSIAEISTEVRELATRARAKKLRPEEMSDGVFSISNLGMFGVDRFSAVINPPEGMILAVGAARDVPIVKAGAVVPGKRCAVTLSCDHRVVDGALGAQFLQALRALVERPVKILL
jgi:pyruvate dehydrogenase E2 component (dihydrolipoamide acetyltransferase)